MNTAQSESVAKALIVNDLNQALILTVGDYKDHPEKSFKPDLPGGLVDPGESERDAVVREVYEETGITLSVQDVTLQYTETKFYDNENKSVTKLLYVARIPKIPPITLSWEHVAHEWIAIDTILQTTELRPFYKEALEYLMKNKLLQ